MKTIFDFHKEADTSNWYVVVDGVMGGESTGNFEIDEGGYGLFEGEISLANNGGFSSIRYDLPEKIEFEDYKYVSNLESPVKNACKNNKIFSK